ncbi:MAG: hypothetical protein K2M79_02840 [Muribaculaceae bacterium]|nr:hypothetical protein [Muribaculaceae bacterium]
MNEIKNPSVNKLSWFLLPLFLVILYDLITRTIPLWSIIIGSISLVLFLIIFTGNAVRQRCYAQMFRIYAILAMFAAFMVYSLIYLPSKFPA